MCRQSPRAANHTIFIFIYLSLHGNALRKEQSPQYYKWVLAPFHLCARLEIYYFVMLLSI